MSLTDAYPWRFEAPIMILVTLGMLIAGLTTDGLYLKQLLEEGTYSVLGTVDELWSKGNVGLAIVIFLFSVVFPIIKLVAQFIMWFTPMTHAFRHRVLHWLGILGKWSMLDVFAAALLIVLIKAGGLFKAEALGGIYLFGAAIFMSMVITMYIDWLATRFEKREEREMAAAEDKAAV